MVVLSWSALFRRVSRICGGTNLEQISILAIGAYMSNRNLADYSLLALSLCAQTLTKQFEENSATSRKVR
jgi:hypothetical protein